MDRNEIFKAYGTDYQNMTIRLLEKAGARDLLAERAAELKEPPAQLKVALKPNILSCIPAEFGATTHIEVVAGIIEFLEENGYTNIRIMEGSWVGDTTWEAAEILGYRDLAAHYGVPFIDTQKEAFYKADCGGMDLYICNCVQDVEFMINIPVLKGHCQTQVTCALKNMKGLIPNSEKRRFHRMGLHEPIAHLNTHIRQDLIVVDHICGDPDFEEGGSPLVRNCVMAARDPVLTDAYAASILGYRPEEVGYIRLASELAIGSMDLDTLRIITTEGENREEMPNSHKLLEVSYAVEDVDCCSACYGMLIGALNRLREEGLLEQIEDKICIGQGFRGKSGKLGIGNCTGKFEFNIPGCPPDEEEIYSDLKKYAEQGMK